jgi:hypothetical protein
MSVRARRACDCDDCQYVIAHVRNPYFIGVFAVSKKKRAMRALTSRHAMRIADHTRAPMRKMWCHASANTLDHAKML